MLGEKYETKKNLPNTTENRLNLYIHTHQSKESEETGRYEFMRLFSADYLMEFTTERYDRADVRTTAITDMNSIALVEIKHYNKPRPYNKFPNYQIDYDKLQSLVEMAEKEGRKPVLVVFFSDYVYIWDLSRANWRNTRKMVNVSAYGGENYGKVKEETTQAYLEFDEGTRLDHNGKIILPPIYGNYE